MTWEQVYKELCKPFDEKDIKWRAGATTRDKTKAQALAYAEPRVYEQRLNDCVGHNWEVHFTSWGELKIICELNIMGKTRSSTGQADEPTDYGPQIQATTAEAQAFKRACAKFGLGKYLYDFPTQWVAYDQQKKQLIGKCVIPSFARKKSETKVNSKYLKLTGEQLTRYKESLTELTGETQEEKLLETVSNYLGKEFKTFRELTQEEANAAYQRIKKVENMTIHRKKGKGDTREDNKGNLDGHLKKISELLNINNSDEIIKLSLAALEKPDFNNVTEEEYSGAYARLKLVKTGEMELKDGKIVPTTDEKMLSGNESALFHRELNKIGIISKQDRYNIASTVLARPIFALTELKHYELDAVREASKSIINGDLEIKDGNLIVVQPPNNIGKPISENEAISSEGLNHLSNTAN